VPSSRFTLWLDDDERDALAREADDEGASFSYVVRLALRCYVGLPVPRRATERMSERFTFENVREREPAA
jgi:hypothetical protein